MTEWQLAMMNLKNIKPAPAPGQRECAAPDCDRRFEVKETHPSQIYCCPTCSGRTRKRAKKAN